MVAPRDPPGDPWPFHGEPPDATGGILLIAAAALAIVVANSPLAAGYAALLHMPLGPLSVIHWINDGLMAIFFLFVGLEIKRELRVGALSSWSSRILPGAAAIAGMIVPAAIYVLVVRGDADALHGWAIPTATDIAFALGIMGLLGSRIPPSLRMFLTAVAIIDDLGAIAVIGAFYTVAIDFSALAFAAAGLGALAIFNRAGVRVMWPYLLIGGFVWLFVQRSGIHATVAGVAVALLLPIDDAPNGARSVLVRLEHWLDPLVTFFIVPLFGLANAGVTFARDGAAQFLAPIPLAVAVALVVGKQVGVFGTIVALTRLGIAQRLVGASWRQLYGASVLCGIGFTMSLFIATLAFGEGSAADTGAKLGIIGGSLISAIAGYAVLRGSK